MDQSQREGRTELKICSVLHFFDLENMMYNNFANTFNGKRPFLWCKGDVHRLVEADMEGCQKVGCCSEFLHSIPCILWYLPAVSNTEWVSKGRMQQYTQVAHFRSCWGAACETWASSVLPFPPTPLKMRLHNTTVPTSFPG